MYRQFVLSFILIFLSLQLFSQAGNAVYSFLDLPVSSRIAALGGTNVSLRENDLSFAFRNPAALSSESSKQLSLSMANYLADIQFGSVMYGFSGRSNNYFAVGVQYIDYGTFDKRSELNVSEGTFTAKDMALNIVYARPISSQLTAGATLKPIFSFFEGYSSYGVAFDAGVNYNDSAHFFSAGLVLRNVGTQLKGYYSNESGQHYEPLPFDIQLGVSKKLAHAPFRISMTLHNLQHWNLNYASINQPQDNLTANSTDASSISFVDMAFRHSIFGVEFVPGKNFYLAASYNHRRHEELKMPGFKSSAGFSFGGGIKLYKFHVGFGMSNFQVGNTAYQFSIATSLNAFRL
ncbi:MAG: hypothetical protein AUK44_03095 [Porphyromonadaceae bacterium CG2_30_38_12]|nr:MAG: hypothetical protein AUK44_03095 [Porphyromonadaceae bacterium CG2_30_38_12]